MVAFSDKLIHQQKTQLNPNHDVYLIVKDTAKVGGLTASFASLVIANYLGVAAHSLPIPSDLPIYASTGVVPTFTDSSRISFSGISFGELAQLLFPSFRELTPEESVQHSAAFGSFFS